MKNIYEVVIITIILFILTMFSASAENWRLAGGSTTGSNFSADMTQDFYYQYANNESNMTVFTNADCGATSTYWGLSGCNLPIAAGNRSDFSEYATNKYLWWHPINITHGGLIKFVAPQTSEYHWNVSFFKTTGGNNVLFNVSKNGVAGTNLYSVVLAGGGKSFNNGLTNLTAGENIVFFVTTADSNSGDSSGIMLNITDSPTASVNPINISIDSPTNTTYTNPNITINFSAVSNTTIDKLFYNNGTNNLTYTNTTTILLNNGNYLFTFYANDTAGYNATGNVNFTVNTPAASTLNLTVYSPTNTTYITNNITITLNATSNYPIQTYWYSNGTANITLQLITSNNVSVDWNQFRKELNNSGFTNSIAPTSITTPYATFNATSVMYGSCSVANGYVYCPVEGPSGMLYQLNASNISQKVNQFLLAGTGGDSTPLVTNEYVYVGSYNATIYQLNASNITKVIGYYVTGSANCIASPKLYNGNIYLGCYDGVFRQLNATNISQQINSFVTSPAGAIDSSAAIMPIHNSIYYGDRNGYYHQLNLSNISQEINRLNVTDIAFLSPSCNDLYCYMGNANEFVVNSTFTMYQVNATNISKVISSINVSWPIDSSPAIANGYIYFGGYDGIVYQANQSNISQIINRYDTLTTGLAGIDSSPAVTKDYLFIGSLNNKIYMLNATNITQLISSYLTGGDVFQSPAVANGAVYVGSFDSIIYQFGNGTIATTSSGNYVNTTILLNDGNYNFSFYSNDSSGAVRQVDVSFNISFVNQSPTFTNDGKVNGAYIFDGFNDILNVTDININSIITTTLWTNNGVNWTYLVSRNGTNYTNLVLNNSEVLPYRNNSGYLIIGQYSDLSYYSGRIDEFQSYDYYVSDEQLSLNYNNNLQGKPNYELSTKEITDAHNYSALIISNGSITNTLQYNLPFLSTMDYLQLDFFPLPNADVRVSVRNKVLNNSIPYNITFLGTISNYTFSGQDTITPLCTQSITDDCMDPAQFLVSLQSYNITISTSDGLNTCLYTNQNFVNQTTYNLSTCIIYNSLFNTSIYNIYNGQAIPNFTLTISLDNTGLSNWTYQPNFTTTSTANGLYLTNFLTKGINYTLLYTQASIINQTRSNYYLENSSQYLNQSVLNNNITFIIRNTASDEILNGITVIMYDLNNSFNFTTATGYLNIAPLSNTNMFFNFTSFGYIPKLVNYTFTGGEIRSINVTLNPIVNITFRDERTFGPFNMLSPQQVRYELYCVDNTVVSNIISNSSSIFPLIISCEFLKIRFLVDYPADAYYRTIVITPTVNQTNFIVWLVDLNNSKVVYNTFQTENLFSDYINPKVVIYRIINITEEQITGDYADIENKITAFLLLNEEYTIKVFSDNKPDKIIGRYSADTSGTKYLRLYETTLTSTATAFNNEVASYSYLLNESGLLDIKTAYQDVGTNVALATVYIYNKTSTSNLLFTSSSTNSSAVFTYPLNTNQTTSDAYYVVLNLTAFNGTVVSQHWNLQGKYTIDFPATFEDPWTLKWIILIILVIFAFSMTIRTAPIGNLAIVGLLILLATFGFFVPGPTVAIAAGVIGILGLIAIAGIFKEGAQ